MIELLIGLPALAAFLGFITVAVGGAIVLLAWHVGYFVRGGR
jgi:hypothetical protein